MRDGDPTAGGLLGAKIPRAWRGGWRVFWTQQHGDNNVWEVIPSGSATDKEVGADVTED